MQAWFAREFPGSSPYRLFALSNFASMLALLGYPFLFEPWLASPQQSLGLVGGYVALRGGLRRASPGAAARSPPLERAAAATAEEAAEPRPAARSLLVWLALASMGSVTLLAVSNHLTQNISSIPLLWVIPLAIYLLTFILCFEGTRWYRRDAYLGFLVWIALRDGVVPGRQAPAVRARSGRSASSPSGLYVVCMFCHGELARLRPGPRHLTLFYLVVSLGGVRGRRPRRDRGAPDAARLPRARDRARRGGRARARTLNLDAPQAHRRPCSRSWRRSPRARSSTAWTRSPRTRCYVERNFYGVLRVKEVLARDDDPETRYRSLVHGAILHGEQWLSDKYRRAATTYYKTSSGIGKTILAHEGQPIKVGVIGLGAGTLATYGDADDIYRFYDINPAVPRIARELVHLPQGQPGEDRDRAGRRAPQPRARAAAGLRRPRGGRLLGRLDPGAPHHARGGGRVPAGT